MMGLGDLYWILKLFIVFDLVCCVTLREDDGHQIKFLFHSECIKPFVTTCPPNDVDSPQTTSTHPRPVSGPELVISQLAGSTVGILSLLHIDLPDVLQEYGFLRLSLFVQGSKADETCISIIRNLEQNTLENICIIIVPENSARLTIGVLVPFDRYCDCDGRGGAGQGLKEECRWKCSPIYPLWNTNVVDVGQLACSKHIETEEITMDLYVWEITPDLLMFEFSAFISNPFARVNVYIHTNDEHNPAPLLEFLDVLHTYGNVYLRGVQTNTGNLTFYAKLCMQCVDDDWSFSCFITEDVSIKSKHVTTTISYNRHGLQRRHVDSSERPPTAVFIGSAVAVILILTLATFLVYQRRKLKKVHGPRRRAVEADINNKTIESTPLCLNGDLYRKAIDIASTENMCVSQVLKNCQSKEKRELVQGNMLLYHPDTPAHESLVGQFVEHLSSEEIKIDGLPYYNVIENWRDFAEKAGDIYTNIVIIYSKGLHDLLNTFYARRVCKKSKELWEQLLQQRHEEYIPCVALMKLKHLYHQGDNSYIVHFVFFNDIVSLEMEDMISKHFSFLKTLQRKYCLFSFKKRSHMTKNDKENLP